MRARKSEDPERVTDDLRVRIAALAHARHPDVVRLGMLAASPKMPGRGLLPPRPHSAVGCARRAGGASSSARNGRARSPCSTASRTQAANPAAQASSSTWPLRSSYRLCVGPPAPRMSTPSSASGASTCPKARAPRGVRRRWPRDLEHRNVDRGRQVHERHPGALVEAAASVGLSRPAGGVPQIAAALRRRCLVADRIARQVQRRVEGAEIADGLRLRGAAHARRGRHPMRRDPHQGLRPRQRSALRRQPRPGQARPGSSLNLGAPCETNRLRRRDVSVRCRERGRPTSDPHR